MSNLKVDDLFAAGAHFGHRTNRWNPKMKPFIFEAKKGVYVIDLNQTYERLETALAYITKSVKEGKVILFVGTKNQVKKPLEEMAKVTGMPYVSGKWLGGYLTNFSVIRKTIKKYQDLISQRDSGRLDKYNKKEKLDIERTIKKLDGRVGGVSSLSKLPDVIFIWDIKEESTALVEAGKKNIPVIAICDTNVNPDGVAYPIPANDDSSKTAQLIMGAISETILEAKK